MWTLYEMDRSSSAYHVEFIEKFRGPLDVSKLAAAVKAVAGKHESLRTVYGSDATGGPFQCALSMEEWEFPVYEVTVAGNSDAKMKVTEEFEKAFTLEKSPMRLSVVHVGKEEHIVVLMLHHIATDGWSAALITDGIVAAYNDLVAGRAVSLHMDESQLRYSDYAQWQREVLADERMMTAHLQYWCDALGGELAVLELQMDRPRPAMLTSNGCKYHFDVSVAASQGLAALCSQCAVTLMNGGLAVWASLLGKYCGQDEVVVGIPYANREHPATHDVVGYFVNTLAVRVSMQGSESFRAVVKRTSDMLSASVAHAVVPFVKVVEAVAPVRDVSRTPIFQTMMVWEEAGGWGELGEGLAGLQAVEENEDNSVASAKFEILLNMADQEESGTMHCSIEYNTDLYDQITIECMAAHLSNLAQQLVQQPDRAMSELHMLSAEEERQLVETWNATQQKWHETSTAQELLEQQAGAVPAAMAVHFEGTDVSYEKLMRATAGLAGEVQQAGAGADRVVGLCVEKSLEEVCGMVGIMRAGAAYVPLDHRLPRGRLEYLVEQCESSVVVVMRQHSAVVEPLGVAVVEAEGALWKAGAGGSQKGKVVRGAGCDSRSLAYTLFTSGSTGKPKGVMIEHQSLVCFLCHEGEDGPYKAMQVEAKHTRLYVLAFTFDDSVGVVWKTLTSGARLVVGKPDAWLDPPYMVKLMQAVEVRACRV